ncbi:MAG TPA: VOC family protein [Solirubrobacteraceae bacterium]|nr:VOC family protein [Solirubrobacteraceae bacterium]
MKSNRSVPSAITVPVLTVADVREAVAWLSEAFGFTERLRIGEGHRSQLEVPGGGAVILAEVRPDTRLPTPGSVAHSVLVRVTDARAHFERSRAAGARILMEPTDFGYGERQYAAEDPFGHRWTFSETLADIDPQEWLTP